jgi:hypothetical protein
MITKTRSEILNMKAGAEMDALIAEYVMGWKLITDPAGDRLGEYWSDPKTRDAWTVQMWRPSQFIQHAFYVIEKVIDGETPNDCDLRTTVRGWNCDLGRGFANSETAPEAICKAALISKL